MADLYVCPDCSHTYPDADAFVRHCDIADHCRDDNRPLHLDGCTCGGVGFASHLRDCQWSQR